MTGTLAILLASRWWAGHLLLAELTGNLAMPLSGHPLDDLVYTEAPDDLVDT